tara:strand:+ start:458 stop:919 length:462 start_codon:yes stop_codon:yes gene_type:complete
VVCIPKPKPDQVIRHEVVLGRSERDLISDGIAAYQFNRITTPLVALFSDASAMGLILGGLATYYGFKFEIIPGAYDNALDIYNDWKAQYDSWRETAGDIRADPIGEILSFIIPSIPNPYAGRPIGGSPEYGQPGQPYGPSTPPDWTPGTPRPY